MGDVIQPPTLVKIEGQISSALYAFIGARLLTLGYDIWPDASFEAKPIYKQQIKTKGFVHSRFIVIGHTVTIYVTSSQEEIIITRADDYDMKTFVDFIMWCWGTTRGGRCPFKSPIYFTGLTRADWQLL